MYNVCGVYGFCTSPDNRIVKCDCFPGYSPWDPNIPSKRCYLNVVMDFCADQHSSGSDFTIEVINKADFPNGAFADIARISPVDLDECKNAITNGCFAMAAVLVESVCYRKRMPLFFFFQQRMSLLNARRSNPSTNNIVAFLKVPKVNNTHGIQDDPRRESPSKVVLLAGLLVCSIMALFFAGISIFHHPLAQPYILSKRQIPNPRPVEINLKAFSFLESISLTIVYIAFKRSESEA